nr:MAG TPA: YtxH-like protein [Bacteriophage sp.]
MMFLIGFIAGFLAGLFITCVVGMFLQKDD